MIEHVRVTGYRSIRDLDLTLGRVQVLVGPNGCGKTNLYQAIRLLHAAARGEFAASLAAQGGMPSVLWAGERKRGPVRMTLTARIDDFLYTLSCGLPQAGMSLFALDPEVKEEELVIPTPRRPVKLLKRTRSSVFLWDEEGREITYPFALRAEESALAQIADPQRYAEVHTVREVLRRWRFYHQFRTDPDAPARQPQVAVRTWRLAHDGRDLAAALRTVVENGDGRGLREAIDGAFPGCTVQVVDTGQGRLQVEMQVPGLRRSLAARELSDGTLRFLCLAAALLSPQPPPLLALNEPETSLHPDLLEPLADLIQRASERSQVWATTHSERLAALLERRSGTPPVRLALESGATRVVS